MSGGDLGTRFARAIATRDAKALHALLAPEVDFKAVTPRKFWEGATSEELLEVVFDNWFEESDRIDELVHATAGDPVEDTQQVSYRFSITNPAGRHTVEQHAYYRAVDDRISYLRLVCSGYRPAGPPAR